MFKKWNKKLDKIGRNLDKEVSKAIGLENSAKISGFSSSVDSKRKETENQLKNLFGNDEEVEKITNSLDGLGNLSSNEEERIEDHTAEVIVENKVEENNSVTKTISKVSSLANAIKEYIDRDDTNSELKSIIEDILFQAEKDEVSYADLCQSLFILQDQGLTGTIVDFTTTYEV